MNLSASPDAPASEVRLVPLAERANLRVATPPNQRWVSELWWQPIAYSEMHLCAHYYPIAIRFSHGVPVLGVILASEYVARPLLDPNGMWQGAYMPIAVRTFPFQATLKSQDPLHDLVVPINSTWLRADGTIALFDEARQAFPYLKSVHRLARQLLESRHDMATALDLVLAAGLLVPLPAPKRGDHQAFRPPLFSVDRHKLAALDTTALAAMARRRFAAVDIAFASAFSQHLLRFECQPKGESQRPVTLAQQIGVYLLGLEDIAVDDGELFSLEDLEAIRGSLETAGSSAAELPPS